MSGTILSQSILRPGIADAIWLMLLVAMGVMFAVACDSASHAPSPSEQKQRPTSAISQQKDSGEMFLPKGTKSLS